MSRLRTRRLSYALAGAALSVLALSVGGAGATSRVQSLKALKTTELTSSVEASASKGKKGVTKAQVKKIVKSQLKKRRGPAGPTGPVGPAGAPGPAGTPAEGIGIKKLSFRTNAGGTLQVPFEGPGMRLEAECASGFQLRFRATEAGNLVHALAVGAGGVTYSAGGQTEVNNAIDLVPNGEPIVSGKLEYTTKGGSNVTVNYLAAFGTSQGDCVFTGTIAQA